VAGAVTQSLFHNPLASPSVLGISSGGCLAVVLVFVSDLHLKIPALLPLSAFTGCMATLCLVYALSCLQQGSRLTRLILTGIAVSSLIIALQNLVLYSMRHNWQLIQTISEWESGSSLDRNWSHVHLQLPLTLIGLGGCWLYRKELNILALGEEEAQNLGIEVRLIRWRLFLCISLLTAGSLAALGMIAFFGLVLPHVIRQLQGADNNRLIPLCIVGGAAVLITFDLFLRQARLTSFSIGNLSAIIGGMFFLFLLFYNQKQAEHGFAR
jgi:iron complex transport system permease protein